MINIIAACDNNYLIGLNGKLPWHIPADLKRFKELTTGHAVIMGRKTFESLGSKPLPDRMNLVISRRTTDKNIAREYLSPLKYAILYDLEDALSWERIHHHEEIFIIGGASLYAEAMPIADRIYMTRVDTFVPVKPEDEAVYFPHKLFDVKDWEMTGNEIHPSFDAAHPSIAFQVFERRK